MKKIKTFVAAAGAILFTSFTAEAGTISFADYATGNEGGIENGSSIDFGGRSIAFYSGSNFSTTPSSVTFDLNYFPYFDAPTGSLPGGLGVCKRLDGSPGNGAPGAHCLDGGDDSVDGINGRDEAILMVFNNPFQSDNPFRLTNISFRDGEHNLINDSTGQISFLAVANSIILAQGVTTIADLVSRVIAGEFEDGLDTLTLGYVDTEFYIESISDVPIPGALPLLLSGLAGLGFTARKKKKATA